MYGLDEIVALNTDRQNAVFFQAKLEEFLARLEEYEDVDNIIVDMREVLGVVFVEGDAGYDD